MKKAVFTLLAFFTAQAQEIISVNPESAETGELLVVTITGTDTRFRNTSMTSNYLHLVKNSTVINAYRNRSPDSLHIISHFHIPSNADTGLWDVTVTAQDVRAIDAFRITPPSDKIVLTGMYPKSFSSDNKKLILGLSVRNLSAAYPDVTGMQIILGGAERKSTSVFSPAQDSLVGRFNMQNAYSWNNHDLILTDGNSDTVIFFPEGFGFISKPRSGIKSVNPKTMALNAKTGVIIQSFGTRFMGDDIYRSKCTIWLFKDNLTLYSDTYDVRSDTVLAAEFWIPPYAEPGSWHLGIYNAQSLVMKKDSMWHFDAVTIQKQDEGKKIAYLSPDSGLQAEPINLNVGIKNFILPQTLQLSDFRLIRKEQVIVPLSVTVVNNTLLRAEFAPKLTDSLGHWDLNLKSGTDTISQFCAFKLLPPPNPSLKGLSQTELRQGESVRMKLGGNKTHFISVQKTQDVYLQKGDKRIEAKTTEALNDTLMNVVFHIPPDAETGLWNFFLKQHWQFGTVEKPGAINILTGNTKEVLTSAAPNEAAQGEKWAMTLFSQNTSFSGFGGPMEVVLLSPADTVKAVSVAARDDVTLKISLEVPSDAVPGYYDLCLIRAPGDTLKLYHGFEIKPLRKLTAVNPVYVLRNTKNFKLEIKGWQLGLTSENGNGAHVQLQYDRSEIQASSVTIINPDSLIAHIHMNRYQYRSPWDVKVEYGGTSNRTTLTLKGAVHFVDSLPAESASMTARNHPPFGIRTRGGNILFDFLLTRAGNVEIAVLTPYGRQKVLLRGEQYGAGRHTRELNGWLNGFLPGGLYMCLLKMDGKVIAKKIAVFFK